MDNDVDNLEDWADVSRDVEPEFSTGSYSPAEVVDMNSAKETAHFVMRRDSTDSVEIMSVNSEDMSSGHSIRTSKSEKCPSLVAMYPGLHNDYCHESPRCTPDMKDSMLCSGCMSQSMKSGLGGSIVHVKMEEIETQTDDQSLVAADADELDDDPLRSLSRLLDNQYEETSDDDSKPPSLMKVTSFDDSNTGPSFIDRVEDFCRQYWGSMMVIPTHLIFAVLVLSTAYSTGIIKVNFLEDDGVRGPVDSPRHKAELTVIRELQSPEWLQQLSLVLDDVSLQLINVDGHVSAVEKQLEQFDRQDITEKSDGKHQFVVDAYRQLIEKQRSAAKLLDKINTILYNDRQPRSEPSALLDVRLKLVDIAGDFVTLSSRLIEVTLANKRRHVNIVKKISTEAVVNKRRIEAAFLMSLLDHIRRSPGAAFVDIIDSRVMACRRILSGRNDYPDPTDLTDCFLRSRLIADETAQLLNSSLELKSLVARYRDRALVAERTVSELREELSMLNETLFLYEKKHQATPPPAPKGSVLQCFSKCADLNSFSELLRSPQHCHICDLIEQVLNQFMALLNRISAAILNKEWPSWSVTAMLDMLKDTFNSLNPSRNRPVNLNSGWTNRLKTHFGSVKTKLSNAYDKLKRNLDAVWPSKKTASASCSGAAVEFDHLSKWVRTLQHTQYFDADELNKLFKRISSLNEKTKSSLCLKEQSQRFLDCQLAWAGRMMRLFKWPVCSDRLPQDCLSKGHVLPWQLHMMTSVEMPDNEDGDGTGSNSTEDAESSSWMFERARGRENLRSTTMKPAVEEKIVADNVPVEQKKKGDDGRFEDVNPVKDIAISHEFCYAHGSVSACRFGMSEAIEPTLPDSFLSLLNRMRA